MTNNHATPCEYCDGAGPEPGFLYVENNGPIVCCPICNTEGKWRADDYDEAFRQRANQKETDR